MANFYIQIITPNGIYLEDEITRLDISTHSGQIGVLANHVPIISAIEIAPVTIIKGDKSKTYALHGGLLNVTRDEVIIITEAIESSDEIDVKRAKEAKAKAEKLLSSKETEISMKKIELALKKSITRLKL